MTDNIVHTITVEDPIGLHARPVGQIVTLVRESGLTVSLRRPGGPEASAVSALKMLAMKVKVGESLEIVVESDDAEEARALAASVEALINQA